MLEYVSDQSLQTNPSHPVCLFMWLGRLAPKLGPNPSFTLAIPAIRCVWLLSLNGCRQTKSTLLHSEVHSFLTFIPQTCIEEPCVRLGGRETGRNAGLALKAGKLYEQIIRVMRRACDNRGMYRNV